MAADRQDRIDTYRQRAVDDPRSGIFVPLAELLAVAGDVDGAVEVLEEGLSRNPASLPGRVVLGRILLTAGRASRGRELLGEVLASDPGNIVARRLLADDSRGVGDWDAAVTHLEGLVAADPGDERWTRELAEARRTAAGRQAAVRSGGFATMTMVDIYIAQGYHARAAEALRRILEAEPQREDALTRLAKVEAAMAADPGAEPPADAERPAAGTEDRQRRRAEQKAQFADWIDRLRHDPGGEA